MKKFVTKTAYENAVKWVDEKFPKVSEDVRQLLIETRTEIGWKAGYDLVLLRSDPDPLHFNDYLLDEDTEVENTNEIAIEVTKDPMGNINEREVNEVKHLQP